MACTFWYFRTYCGEIWDSDELLTIVYLSNVRCRHYYYNDQCLLKRCSETSHHMGDFCLPCISEFFPWCLHTLFFDPQWRHRRRQRCSLQISCHQTNFRQIIRNVWRCTESLCDSFNWHPIPLTTSYSLFTPRKSNLAKAKKIKIKNKQKDQRISNTHQRKLSLSLHLSLGVNGPFLTENSNLLPPASLCANKSFL